MKTVLFIFWYKKRKTYKYVDRNGWTIGVHAVCATMKIRRATEKMKETLKRRSTKNERKRLFSKQEIEIIAQWNVNADGSKKADDCFLFPRPWRLLPTASPSLSLLARCVYVEPVVPVWLWKEAVTVWSRCVTRCSTCRSCSALVAGVPYNFVPVSPRGGDKSWWWGIYFFIFFFPVLFSHEHSTLPDRVEAVLEPSASMLLFFFFT